MAFAIVGNSNLPLNKQSYSFSFKSVDIKYVLSFIHTSSNKFKIYFKLLLLFNLNKNINVNIYIIKTKYHIIKIAHINIVII